MSCYWGAEECRRDHYPGCPGERGGWLTARPAEVEMDGDAFIHQGYGDHVWSYMPVADEGSHFECLRCRILYKKDAFIPETCSP